MNTTDIVPATAQQEAVIEGQKAAAARGQIEALVVVTPKDIELASEILIALKTEYKRVVERKETFTKPINALVKAVRDHFSPAEKAYSDAESILKRKIATAQRAIEEANHQAMLATQAALAQNNVREAAALSSAIVQSEAPAGITFQERWVWRVVNAALLPRDFLMPDEKKIAEHVKKHGAGANIPGVVVEKDVGIIARTGAQR